MSSDTLAEKVITLHQSLDASAVDHAFGGAFALAYCTLEPRPTRNIDVNIFLRPEEIHRLEAALPEYLHLSDVSRNELTQDGQSRLWWDDTAVNVFLSTHPFHDQVAANRRFVPFADIAALPVVACGDLAVFKTFFGRPEDARDVAAMVSVRTINLDDLMRETTLLLRDSDQRGDFFDLVRFSTHDDEP